MNQQELLEAVVWKHDEKTEPQRRGLAQLHYDSLLYAIGGLAALGSSLEVVMAPLAAPLQYPKMLYRDQHTPMVVENSEEEAKAEADGWEEHGMRVKAAAVAVPGPPPVPSHPKPVTEPEPEPEHV